MASDSTSDLKFVSSSQVSAVVLFPQTRNFTPHSLSSPSCVNGYRRSQCWGVLGGGGGGGGG